MFKHTEILQKAGLLPANSVLRLLLDGVPEYCEKNLKQCCVFPVAGYEKKFYEGYQMQKDAEKKEREAWDLTSELRDENKKLRKELEELKPLREKVALLEEELNNVKVKTFDLLLTEIA